MPFALASFMQIDYNMEDIVSSKNCSSQYKKLGDDTFWTSLIGYLCRLESRKLGAWETHHDDHKVPLLSV